MNCTGNNYLNPLTDLLLCWEKWALKAENGTLSVCACLVVHLCTCGMSVDKNVSVRLIMQRYYSLCSGKLCLHGPLPSAWKVLEWDKVKDTWSNLQQSSDGISCVLIFPRYLDLNISHLKQCVEGEESWHFMAHSRWNDVIVSPVVGSGFFDWGPSGALTYAGVPWSMCACTHTHWTCRDHFLHIYCSLVHRLFIQYIHFMFRNGNNW